MPEAICIKGTLTNEGAECQALRSTDEELFTLVGDFNGFQNGDNVFVCGPIVEDSTCMQGTTIGLIWITDDIDQALENSLKQEIKARFPNQFVEAKWKKRPFSKFTNDDDDPKVIVLVATRRVGSALGIVLDPEVEHALQGNVDLTSTPEDILPLMREALV